MLFIFQLCLKLDIYDGAKTLGLKTFNIMTLSITTFNIMTLSIATFRFMTLSITVNKMRHSA